MACDFPITIDNPAYKIDRSAVSKIPVPCRKCPPCLAKRSNHWIFKLLQQDKIATSAYFCTFSYSNEHMSKQTGRISAKGYMTLVKADFQKYMKRLRKLHQDGTILKYYAVGEYGSTTYRPHFHAILFNSTPENIEASWPFGRVYIDEVNGNTVAYTTKYMHKGRLIPVHQNDDRVPEFQLFSKGLGNNYINDETIAYHNADISRNYVTGEGGVKIPMPAIYRAKIFSESNRKKQGLLVQSLVREQEDKRQHEYKSIYGSLEGYYKSQAESKRSAVETFRERQKKRNKL